VHSCRKLAPTLSSRVKISQHRQQSEFCLEERTTRYIGTFVTFVTNLFTIPCHASVPIHSGHLVDGRARQGDGSVPTYHVWREQLEVAL